MKSIVLAAAIVLPGLSFAQDGGSHLDRLFKEAQSEDTWGTSKTVSDKLKHIREVALKKDVVSDPVSDRYLITALGGPIDIVHFLGLAIQVCSGSLQREEALLAQWKSEGGPDFEVGRSRTYPPEAHPDDLPSNTLGALFGEEIHQYNNDPKFDVIKAMKDFLSPLEPVADDIAKKFSHQKIVMGLNSDASVQVTRSRNEWFTAKPLFSLYAFDPDRARGCGDSSAALRKAGFVVRSIDGKAILIERVSAKN